MKNAFDFDLRQFSSINQRHPVTKKDVNIMCLESVGMNVYLYNIVGFQCIANCYTEYVL